MRSNDSEEKDCKKFTVADLALYKNLSMKS